MLIETFADPNNFPGNYLEWPTNKKCHNSEHSKSWVWDFSERTFWPEVCGIIFGNDTFFITDLEEHGNNSASFSIHGESDFWMHVLFGTYNFSLAWMGVY